MPPLQGSYQKIFPNLTKTIRFGLSAATYSLIPWTLIAVGTLTLSSGSGVYEPRMLYEAFAIGIWGVILAPLAMVGLRFNAKLPGSTQVTKITLSVIWILGLSIVWWVSLSLRRADISTADGFWNHLANPFFAIPMVAATFCVAYFLRQSQPLMYLQRRRDAKTAQRRLAYRNSAKVQRLGNLDVPAILEQLDLIETAYKTSHRRGRNLLSLLKHEILVQSDPRVNMPVSLPIAMGIVTSDIIANKKAETWPVTLHVAPASSFPEKYLIEPSVVRALVAFVTEYGLVCVDHPYLSISFEITPKPIVRIRTNIKEQDFWFTLEEHSAALTAKNRLVTELNRIVISKGLGLDIKCDKGSVMTFDLQIEAFVTEQGDWQGLEEVIGPDDKLVSECALSNGCNRVYASNDKVYKLQRLDLQSPKATSLWEEYAILKQLDGVRGVPRAVDFGSYGRFAVLSCSKLSGIPLDQYLAGVGYKTEAWVRCIVELSGILNDIHQKGIVHRDLRPDNILVDTDGRISLVDFDQAVQVRNAGQIDMRGEAHGLIEPCISMRDLLIALGLTEEYSRIASTFKTVWEIGKRSGASSPGEEIAYYHWLFGDLDLPGEREWFARWNLIQEPLRRILPGARVLDMGCNMGLLATHCKLYGAESVTAIDIHKDILGAGRLLADAMGVSVNFVQCDLNVASSVESTIGDQRFDLILVLSVLHWLKDSSYALSLLESASAILYEGHDSLSGSMKLLNNLGFTRIEVLGYSERLRAICLAMKV